MNRWAPPPFHDRCSFDQRQPEQNRLKKHHHRHHRHHITWLFVDQLSVWMLVVYLVVCWLSVGCLLVVCWLSAWLLRFVFVGFVGFVIRWVVCLLCLLARLLACLLACLLCLIVSAFVSLFVSLFVS